jgi:hypothetical protein
MNKIDRHILVKVEEFVEWAEDHMTEIKDLGVAKDIEGMLIHLGLDFTDYLEGMYTIDELLK